MCEVEHFTFDHAFGLGDVEYDDVAEFLGGGPQGAACADVSGADDCDYSLDPNQLATSLASSPDAFLVYNQQAEAQALVEQMQLPSEQILVEIRQDTKGVLGLHAMRKTGSEVKTLELVYQE